MELRLRRIALKKEYTIGKLYIDGVYFCDVLEPPTRDLNKNGVFDNGEQKVEGKTAIPYGRYPITLDVKSPKYSNFAKYPWAEKYDGYLPRLMNVKTHVGVLIHAGNYPKDTAGCCLVGENKIVGAVVNSQQTFQKLMDNYLLKAKKNKEPITITIV